MGTYKPICFATLLVLAAASVVSADEPARRRDLVAKLSPLGGAGARVERTPIPTGDVATSVLYLEKAVPASILVGHEFSYTLRLTNLTGATVAEADLIAELPKNFTLSGTSPATEILAGKATWAVGPLAAGKSKVFAIRGTATRTGPMFGCADVTYRTPTQCVAFQAVRPDLEISMTAPAEVLLCDAIPARIFVRNAGTGPATNVRISDALPGGLMTTDGKELVAFDLGTLAAGQTRELNVLTRAARAGTFTATATLKADDGWMETAVATTIVREPILVVTKTGPSMRYLGREATYSVTVANTGDGVARGTMLADMVPAGMRVLRIDADGEVRDDEIKWSLGNLAPGESRTVNVRLLMIGKGTARSTAKASAYCAAGSDDMVTVIRGIPAILLECGDIGDPVELGNQVTYVIRVTNQGSAIGRNILVKCTLAPEQAFVSASGPTAGIADGQAVTFAALETLAPKKAATYRVVVKGVRSGDVRFKVSLTSDQMRTPVEETESTHIYSD